MPTHFLSAKWDAEQRWGAEWSFQKWPKQTFTCLTCEHGWKIHQHQNPLSIKIGTSHLGNISGDQPHRPEVRHPKLIHIKSPWASNCLYWTKQGAAQVHEDTDSPSPMLLLHLPSLGRWESLAQPQTKTKTTSMRHGGSTANPKVQQVKKIDDITTTLRNHPTFSYSSSLHLAMKMVYRSTPLHKHKGSAGNPNKIIEGARGDEKKTYRRNHATSSLQ